MPQRPQHGLGNTSARSYLLADTSSAALGFQNVARCSTSRSDRRSGMIAAVSLRLGSGTGAVRVAPGPFPVPARRTGCVEIHITGSAGGRAERTHTHEHLAARPTQPAAGRPPAWSTSRRARWRSTRPGVLPPPSPRTCCAGCGCSASARRWPTPNPKPCATGCCTPPTGSSRGQRKRKIQIPESWPWADELAAAFPRRLRPARTNLTTNTAHRPRPEQPPARGTSAPTRPSRAPARPTPETTKITTGGEDRRT